MGVEGLSSSSTTAPFKMTNVGYPDPGLNSNISSMNGDLAYRPDNTKPNLSAPSDLKTLTGESASASCEETIPITNTTSAVQAIATADNVEPVDQSLCESIVFA